MFPAAYAFAASFGSTSTGLGAESKLVASCGGGITFSYSTSFDASVSGYVVTGMSVSNIPAGCLGKKLSATFTNGSQAPEGSEISDTLPTSGTSQSIPVDPGSNTIAAGEISGVSLVVW